MIGKSRGGANTKIHALVDGKGRMLRLFGTSGNRHDLIGAFDLVDLEHGEEYQIASNLGTAYELSGMNDRALEWIKRAIDLHSKPHSGTEWLHVKILEAKLQIAGDPQWLESNTVLGLDFGKKKHPEWPDGLKQDLVEQRRLLLGLRYQLKERIQFVAPRDPIVSNLLFDLSNLVALTKTVSASNEILNLAKSYASAETSELIHKRQRYYDALLDGSPGGVFRRSPLLFLLFLIPIVAIFWFGSIARRERREAEDA